jgi:hypothetical protein
MVRAVAGFEASVVLNRKDFGIDIDLPLETGGTVVGDKVTITLEIEALKQACPVQLQPGRQLCALPDRPLGIELGGGRAGGRGARQSTSVSAPASAATTAPRRAGSIRVVLLSSR